MKATPRTSDEYLRNGITNNDRQQTDKMLTQLINNFTNMHNDEHIQNMEVERKDIEPQLMKTPHRDNEQYQKPQTKNSTIIIIDQ